MPAGNRMGPLNMGPRTGRGMGYCAGYDRPGYMNPGAGYAGFGYGGRGHRYWFYATGLPGWTRTGSAGGYYPPAPYRLSEEEEQSMLREQEKWLEEQLNNVRSRIKKSPEE